MWIALKKLLITAWVFFATSTFAFAGTESAQDMYAEALELASRGSPSEAVSKLWDLVRSYPQDAMVDDALFQIGSLNERFLGDFDEAIKAYTSIIRQFPESKTAIRARKRVSRLEASRESGDEPLRLFKQILNQYATLGSEESLARAKELYQQFPSFSERDHVLFWIAEEEFRQRDYAKALEHYNLLLRDHPQSKWNYFAAGKMGRAHVELRDFDAAITAFKRLAEYEPLHPGAGPTSEEELRKVRLFQRLQGLNIVCLVIAGAALLVWLSGIRWKTLSGQNMRAALTDAGILSVIFVAGALLISSKPKMYATTLIFTWPAVAVAGLLNNLFVGTRTFSRAGRAVATVWALVAATAIVFAVYYRMDMVNLLYDSIQYSMEHGE